MKLEFIVQISQVATHGFLVVEYIDRLYVKVN